MCEQDPLRVALYRDQLHVNCRRYFQIGMTLRLRPPTAASLD
jgi:hypothetical protein